MIRTSNKSNINFYIELFILFPFVLLAFSGILIQINYHAGGLLDEANVLGANRNGWLYLHKIVSVISLFGITMHVFLHTWWIKMLFRGRTFRGVKNVKITLWLLILFIITTLTGLVSWLVLSVDEHARFIVIEIHDKIGIILIILVIFHFVNNWRWMAKKLCNSVKRI